MESNKSYKDLDAWNEGINLVNLIYGVTKSYPKEEIYCLTSQLRRAAISIPSNIAEGVGRNHANDTVQFLFVARGSLYEIETQLYISLNQKYITQEEFKEISLKIEKCKKILNGLINYYKNRA